jgi:hypothetical protein
MILKSVLNYFYILIKFDFKVIALFHSSDIISFDKI